jgi:hypothetical protein
MEDKKFYASKTFWVNLIAGIALVVQGVNGNWVVSVETQASILAGLNIVLRFITKGKVTL